MATKQLLTAQNPLILRCNRIMDAFAKSDDERDFYLDRQEGFIIYVDLDKPEEDLKALEKELERQPDRYCLVPKLTFYEAKKIMEGFINEKVYDIDTKEKLLDIIQSKEARENFLEFIYDHHSELEKWQSFYQERSRIRIIEWLRANNFNFVFEEDLEIPRLLLEKVKKELFETRVGKEVQNARKGLFAKAKTYYSSEALNPRPKRGRPPKQIQKTEVEPQISTDIYTTTPSGLRNFLYIPDLSAASFTTFSTRFGNEDDLFTNRKSPASELSLSMESLNQKLEAIRNLSTKWKDAEAKLSHDLPAYHAPDINKEDHEIVFDKKNTPKPKKKLSEPTPLKTNLKKPTPIKAKTHRAKTAPKSLVRKATKTLAQPKKAVNKKPALKRILTKAKSSTKSKPAKKPLKKAPSKASSKKTKRS